MVVCVDVTRAFPTSRLCCICALRRNKRLCLPEQDAVEKHIVMSDPENILVKNTFLVRRVGAPPHRECPQLIVSILHFRLQRFRSFRIDVTRASLALREAVASFVLPHSIVMRAIVQSYSPSKNPAGHQEYWLLQASTERCSAPMQQFRAYTVLA